jgi:toxin ParE1/3/4
MPKVLRQPAAKRDLIHHYVYLAEHASLETAKKFRRSVAATYVKLAQNPRIGAPRPSTQLPQADLRIFPVPGFANFLIAYAPTPGGITIYRLFHAKQDFHRVFGD